jgi:hypothetical protein
MAAALTSLGVAGLFVALVLPGAVLTPASPGSVERQGLEIAATQAPAATYVPAPAATRAGGEFGGLNPAAQATPYSGYVTSSGQVDQNTGAKGTDDKLQDGATQAPPVAPSQVAVGGQGTPGDDAGGGNRLAETISEPAFNPLLIASLAFLGLGLLLFTLLFAARRIR